MSSRKALMAGLCLAVSLHAADIPAETSSTEWAAREQNAIRAMDRHDYAAAAQFFAENTALANTPEQKYVALGERGIALSRAGRNQEAVQALRQALALGSGQEPDRGKLLGFLAAADRTLGDYVTAEQTLRSALDAGASTNATRATLMVSLADLLREEGRDPEAREILAETARLKDLPDKQTTGILVESAELTRDMGLWDESVALWNKVQIRAQKQNSADLEASFAGGLGETWYAAGNLTRAEPLLRRSLALLRGNPEVPSTETAMALALLARLYVDEDKLALAAESLEEAISLDEKALGPSHPQVAILLELRADLLSRRGETADARIDIERARVIMTSHFGAVSSATGGVFAEMGDIEQRANHPVAAVEDYGHAMEIIQTTRPYAPRFTSALLARYAAALKAAHRPDKARALLSQDNAKGFRSK